MSLEIPKKNKGKVNVDGCIMNLCPGGNEVMSNLIELPHTRTRAYTHIKKIGCIIGSRTYMLLT